VHACTVVLSDSVSIENKEAEILIPKLDVAGSIPVARSISVLQIGKSNLVIIEKVRSGPTNIPHTQVLVFRGYRFPGYRTSRVLVGVIR
jgi:hypothetical protein